jgi:dCTP deaminase
MAFWSGERISANQHVVSDFSEDQIDCNSYTLRMGDCYFRTADAEAKEFPTKVFLTPRQAFVIPPGQFGYLLSKETVHIPQKCMAFISMRTGIKYKGLINVSGFHVDPGYQGKLIYAVYNASPSPVQICENDFLFKIWFADMDRESEDRFVFKKKGVSEIDNDLVHGMSKEILSLQSLAEKLRNHENDTAAKFAEQRSVIDTLNIVWRTIIIAAILGVAATIFGAFLAFSLPIVHGWGEKLQLVGPYQDFYPPIHVRRRLVPQGNARGNAPWAQHR